MLIGELGMQSRLKSHALCADGHPSWRLLVALRRHFATDAELRQGGAAAIHAGNPVGVRSEQHVFQCIADACHRVRSCAACLRSGASLMHRAL